MTEVRPLEGRPPESRPLEARPVRGQATIDVRPRVAAAVYPSPGPDMPAIAVIVMGRDLVFSQSVRSVEEGEKLLAHMLSGFAAARFDGPASRPAGH